MRDKKKNYIIFTPSIANIGGAELYVMRRAVYLKSKGWNVKIITSIGSPILIKEFDYFPTLIINFNASFKYIPAKKKEIVLNQIFDFIGISNIIESHTLHDAIICEVIAQKKHLKHIIYLLQESPIKNIRDKKINQFFNFKLYRKELFGITNQSLSLIFDRRINESLNNYVNVPFDIRELDKGTDNFFFPNTSKRDFVIATISRLEKEYVVPLIKSIYNFSNNNKLKLQLIIYGDSKDQKVKQKLELQFKNTNKLNIYFPGYLFPLPYNLFSKLDAFLGMGTSVVNSIAAGCPTLVIDPRSYKCAGILAKDISNFAYAENEIEYSIEQKLLEIKSMNEVELNTLKKRSLIFFNENYEMNSVLKKMDTLIESSKKNIVYWQFDFEYSFIEKLYYLINLIR